MHLVKFGCFQPRHHYPPPTNTDRQGTHRDIIRYIRGPWHGRSKYGTQAVAGYQGSGRARSQARPQDVAPWPAAGWCMLSAPPARSKQPTLLYCELPGRPALLPRPGPGPSCPPDLVPWPITGGAKSYLRACHWTAPPGDHAISAAVWTVSLVKSNHLSGKQPGAGPALANCVPLGQLRRHCRRGDFADPSFSSHMAGG